MFKPPTEQEIQESINKSAFVIIPKSEYDLLIEIKNVFMKKEETND